MNIDKKKKKEKRNGIIRWFIYYLMIAAVYIYMTTVSLPLKTPLLLIPVSLCIAMYEEPFNSALTGLVAGMLLDSAEGTLIGFSGIILMWCCLFTSLLFAVIMKKHFINILLITAGVTFIQGLLRYLFYFSIWDYNEGFNIFYHEFLPVIAMTNVFTALFYYLIKFLVKHLGVIRENFIEEKSDDIVRE